MFYVWARVLPAGSKSNGDVALVGASHDGDAQFFSGRFHCIEQIVGRCHGGAAHRDDQIALANAGSCGGRSFLDDSHE